MKKLVPGEQITNMSTISKNHSHKRTSIFRDILNNPYSYLLLLPAMLYSFIYGYCTLPYMIIAFQKFDYKAGLLHSKWVGLDNFKFFFNSPDAINVTFNTIKLNFLFLIFTTLVALTIAILLNEATNKAFKKISQSTMIFPYFLSWIIVSYVAYSFFNSNYGVVNNLLNAIGLQQQNWYSMPQIWTPLLVLLRVWREAGNTIVIYMAAITGIDESLNEAATIDGANRWQRIRAITFPLLMPTVCILGLLAVGRIFYGDFGMIYAIIGDNGTLLPATDVIDTFVFRALRKTGDPSWAMAVGMYQSLLGFIFIFFSNMLVRKKFEDGALF